MFAANAARITAGRDRKNAVYGGNRMSSSVMVALRVKASPERAFEAFTAEIAQWWKPHPLFALTPRGDGDLRFEADAEGRRLVSELANGKVHEIGRVSVWAPGERLVLSWRPGSVPPDQATELEVRFEAVGDETRVTVEHRGWDRVPPENAARHGFPERIFLHRAGEWWRFELAHLAHRFDQTA